MSILGFYKALTIPNSWCQITSREPWSVSGLHTRKTGGWSARVVMVRHHIHGFSWGFTMFYGVVSVWYLHQVKKALWWARLRWFQAVACKSQAALQRCSLFCASGDWLKTMMQNETAPKSKSNKANPHPVERQHTWTELCRCFSHVGSGWCDDTLQSQTNCQQSQIESMKQSWHTRHTCSSRLYHRQP